MEINNHKRPIPVPDNKQIDEKPKIKKNKSKNDSIIATADFNQVRLQRPIVNTQVVRNARKCFEAI